MRNPCGRYRLGLTTVVRTTREHGWALCHSQPKSQQNAVFETYDGGTSWRSRVYAYWKHGLHQHGTQLGDPDGMTLAHDGHGFLWGYEGVDFGSSDGGRHWRRIPAFTPDDFGGTGSMFSHSGGYFLVWRTNRPDNYWALFRTSDAGRHWSTVRRWKPY